MCVTQDGPVKIAQAQMDKMWAPTQVETETGTNKILFPAYPNH